MGRGTKELMINRLINGGTGRGTKELMINRLINGGTGRGTQEMIGYGVGIWEL